MDIANGGDDDKSRGVAPAKCSALRDSHTHGRHGRVGHVEKQSRRGTSLRSLPNELVAAIVSWMDHREIGAALVASRRFHVVDKRRIYRTMSPLALASAGCLEGVVHKHAIDPWSVDVHCLDAAIAKGRIDVVRWIATVSAGGACPTRILVKAAHTGDVQLMRWAIDEGGATVVMDAPSAAAESGHTDAMRLLYDGRRHRLLDWDSSLLSTATRSGNLEAVCFAYKHCERLSDDGSHVLYSAVNANAIDCVEWLADRCESLSHAKKAFECALVNLNRDCGIAILARWPQAARLAYLGDWMPCIKSPLITLERLDAAMSLASEGPSVKSIVRDLMAGNLSTAAAYDILFNKSLYHYIERRTQSQAPFAFDSRLACDDVLLWCAQRETSRLSFVRDVMIGRRVPFFDMAGQRLRDMSAHSMGWLWKSLGGHVEAMDCLWKLITPSGAHTVTQCDADQGDLVNVAQALLEHCQATANSAANADNIAALDWLRMKCGPRAQCTSSAFQDAIGRGAIAIVERLLADGSHLRRHVPDTHDPLPHGVTTDDGSCAIGTIHAAASGNHRAVLELLYARGALSNNYVIYGAATSAIDAGHVSLAAWLLSTLHVKLGEGSLRDAAARRDLCAVRFLIQAETPLSRESLALDSAIRSGSLAIAKALDEYDPRCWSPHKAVGLAAEWHHDNIVSWAEARHSRTECRLCAHPPTHDNTGDRGSDNGDDDDDADEKTRN